jgi:hypothetical protein
VLDPADSAQLRRIVEAILKSPDLVRQKGQNARRLVAECLAWDKTIGPLAAWCRQPRLREEKQSAAMRDEAREHRMAKLEAELAATRRELATVRGKWIFRLSRQRRFWGPLLAPFAFLASVFISVFLFISLWLTRGSKH